MPYYLCLTTATLWQWQTGGGGAAWTWSGPQERLARGSGLTKRRIHRQPPNGGQSTWHDGTTLQVWFDHAYTACIRDHNPDSNSHTILWLSHVYYGCFTSQVSADHEQRVLVTSQVNEWVDQPSTLLMWTLSFINMRRHVGQNVLLTLCWCLQCDTSAIPKTRDLVKPLKVWSSQMQHSNLFTLNH